MAALSSAALLELRGLGKSYAAPVLRAVDFDVAAGEIVALTGENGAGKSTLSRLVAGLAAPDAGTMRLRGASWSPRSRAAAEAQGVRMVLQELSLVPTLTVAENLLLGRLPARLGFVRRAQLREQARTHLHALGFGELDVDAPVATLGIGQQQLLEIARGLIGEVQLLILDEPTAMLTGSETAHLFAELSRLRARGTGILYISHRLEELRRIADRIVVLRDGALVADRPAAGFAPEEIVAAMVGGDANVEMERQPRPAGVPVLQLAGLGRGSAVRDINLTACAGEVVGLAGLVGAGRTELLRLICGADRADRGSIHLHANPLPARISSPADAVRAGIGFLPEDRKAQGLLLTQSVEFNITMTQLRRISRFGVLRMALARAAARHWSQLLRIRARDVDQTVAELSGGNQQKTLLARWLYRGCRILLLDEPTRGVDVAARRDMYAQIDALAAQGCTLLVASSDLRELMLISDRIAVLSAGHLAGVFARGSWNEQAMLEAAFSAHVAAPPAQVAA
ncbi:MAG: sugar ABC transporter ATP-binding protein [Steroidobacteraceae bacterium]